MNKNIQNVLTTDASYSNEKWHRFDLGFHHFFPAFQFSFLISLCARQEISPLTSKTIYFRIIYSFLWFGYLWFSYSRVFSVTLTSYITVYVYRYVVVLNVYKEICKCVENWLWLGTTGHSISHNSLKTTQQFQRIKYLVLLALFWPATTIRKKFSIFNFPWTPSVNR